MTSARTTTHQDVEVGEVEGVLASIDFKGGIFSDSSIGNVKRFT